MTVKIPTISSFKERREKIQTQDYEASKEFGNSRTCQRFKTKDSKQYTVMVRDGWELRYFNTRYSNTSDYVLFRLKDVETTHYSDSIPVIEFNCDNHTLKFNGWCHSTIVKNIPREVLDMVEEFTKDTSTYKTTPIHIESTSYLKLYIAVLDEVPDNIVPTLVAHSMLGAHLWLESIDVPITSDCSNIVEERGLYKEWIKESFRKCIVRVNRKEFEKISKIPLTYLGHENTTLNGEKSCAVVYPVWSNNIPNVLKFSKLWRPSCT